MSGYNLVELGELQQTILKHFFDCEDQNPESVNHISTVLRVAQPAVFKSVNLLIKHNYLVKDKAFKGGRKALSITAKGAAAAVVLGVSYEKFVNYVTRMANIDNSQEEGLQYIRKFEQVLRVPDKRDFLFRKMLDYSLKNNWYEEGLIKYPSQNDFKLLLAYASVEYNKAFGNVRTLKDLIAKYGLDKKFLKIMFEKERKRIDSIIKQLEV